MSGVRSPLRLLQVPYDSGQFDVRMGVGPLALWRAGAAERLRGQGHTVQEQFLEPSRTWRAELRTAFELHRAISSAVTAARRTGQVPLLLSGNCNATIGVLGGLAQPGQRLGLVWLDAHADFNTPEIDPSGFLDGHGLAMAVGRCWRALTSTVPGFSPLPERQVLLVGARSFDRAEEPALRESEITWLPPAQARDPERVTAALDALTARVDAVHFHVDLDVHDPSVTPANGFAAPGGLSTQDVQKIVRQTADRIPVSSATLAAYDPTHDPTGQMRDTALRLLDLLASVATPYDEHAVS